MTDLFSFTHLPGKPRWEVNVPRNSLDLIVDGRCEGYLVPWQDRKTGARCGWTGVLVASDGQETEYSTSDLFWTPLEKAKFELYSAVVPQ